MTEESKKDEDCEENTGIDAPGVSLEPLIGAGITLEEKEFHS